MQSEDWALILGVFIAVGAAFGPWMLMVHGKLATFAAEITRLAKLVDQLVENDYARMTRCVQNENSLYHLQQCVQEQLGNGGV